MELVEGLSSLDLEVTKAFEGADTTFFDPFWTFSATVSLVPGLQRQLKVLLHLAKGLKPSLFLKISGWRSTGGCREAVGIVSGGLAY